MKPNPKEAYLPLKLLGTTRAILCGSEHPVMRGMQTEIRELVERTHASEGRFPWTGSPFQLGNAVT